ncbi:hypothetical protein K2173_021289 [Erythroxylum novogranatense]|uniref:Cytochrome P450 n=1 Tax=Erythroxylum novogranatense TaxID=1862640 RepID=A0AAV8TUT7_9ROSI|nr:hypothetical protein K2173_021289 [Erythroxylum novogranatense]
MEAMVLYLAFSLLGICLVHKFYQRRTSQRNLPPSPPALPFIGHLYLQKPPMFKTYHKLAQKYGPIFSLRFGSSLVVVVSSASAMEECFTINDMTLANRPKLLAGKHFGYNYTSVDQASYGEHWRNLRRIGATEFFSNTRANMLITGIAKEEVKQLIAKLSHDSLHDFAKVELKTYFQELTFNFIMRMVTGKGYHADEDSVKEAREFGKLIKNLSIYYDSSNPGDFFPFWNWIDGGRFEKSMVQLAKKIDAFLQGIVHEHRNKLHTDSARTAVNSFLLLQKKEPEYFTDDIIKGYMLILFIAGTDTTTVTSEWAMSCLLNNPDKLEKVREEVDKEVGQERLIEDSDLPKLSYLRNVILETLRMYPAAPIIDPHVASEDCVVGGYHIPRGTMVLANAWSLQRDHKLWDDPHTFKPERFYADDGSAYKLMPFGLGRRSCPGMNIAHRVLGLTLGSLIQCFDWQRVSEELLDMTEGSGITMRKVVPLEALIRARPVLKKTISDGGLAS